MTEMLKAARRIRQQFREHGEFTTAAYRRAVRRALPRMAPILFNRIVEQIDAESLAESQPDRHGFDLAGEYALDERRRVGKAKCLLEQYEEHIAYMDQQAEKATEKAFDCYLRKPGSTWPPPEAELQTVLTRMQRLAKGNSHSLKIIQAAYEKVLARIRNAS
jgi:hypothetical protein